MTTLRIKENGTLTIPKIWRSIFRPSDKIAAFLEGDTLIVKKITSSPLSSLSRRKRAKPMPLKEIVKEIRAYRGQK